MKQAVMVTIVMLVVAVGLAQGQQAKEAKDGGLHGWVEMTYQSKYIWRGFDVYADRSAIQPAINLDLFGTGFGMNIAGHRANSSGCEDSERWDYNVYYQNMLFGDQSYATAYRVGWVYYNYPEIRSDLADLQEIHAIFSFPKILPIKGLVPTYVLVKLWPSSSGSLVGSSAPGTASGWAHIFMLDYGLEITCPITNQPRVLNLHSEVVYNDGVHPGGGPIDHDWTNAVFGISTDFDLGNNLTFTPGLYHQITMDDFVNDDKSESWATLGIRYTF
jgi:hypothetical protein